MQTNILFLGFSLKVILLALVPSSKGFPSWFNTKIQEKENAIENSLAIPEGVEFNYRPPVISTSEAPIFTEIPQYAPLPTELSQLITIETFPNSEAGPPTATVSINSEHSSKTLDSSQISAAPFQPSNFPDTGNLSLPYTASSKSEQSQIPVLTTLPSQVNACDENNCLRNFIRSSTILTDFCSSFTASNSPVITELPCPIPQCNDDSSSISSACSCLMTRLAPLSKEYSFVTSSQFSLSATFTPSSTISPALAISGTQTESSNELPLSQVRPTSLSFYPGIVSNSVSPGLSEIFSLSPTQYTNAFSVISSSTSSATGSTVLAPVEAISGPSLQSTPTRSYPILNSTLTSQTSSKYTTFDVSQTISGIGFASTGGFPCQTISLSTSCFNSVPTFSAVNTDTAALPITSLSLGSSAPENVIPSCSQVISVLIPSCTSLSLPIVNVSLVLSIVESIISTISVNSLTMGMASSEESPTESTTPTDLAIIVTATATVVGLNPFLVPQLEVSCYTPNQLLPTETLIPPVRCAISGIGSSASELPNSQCPSILNPIINQTIYLNPTKTPRIPDIFQSTRISPTYTSGSVYVTPIISSNFLDLRPTNNLPSNIGTITESSHISPHLSISIGPIFQNTVPTPVSEIITTVTFGPTETVFLSEVFPSTKSKFESINCSYTISPGSILSQGPTLTESSPLTISILQPSFPASISTGITSNFEHGPTNIASQLSSPNTISASISPITQYSSFESQKSKKPFPCTDQSSNESQSAPSILLSGTDIISPVSGTSSKALNSYTLTNSFTTITSVPSLSTFNIISNSESGDSTSVAATFNSLPSQVTSENYFPTPIPYGYY